MKEGKTIQDPHWEKVAMAAVHTCRGRRLTGVLFTIFY